MRAFLLVLFLLLAGAGFSQTNDPVQRLELRRTEPRAITAPLPFHAPRARHTFEQPWQWVQRPGPVSHFRFPAIRIDWSSIVDSITIDGVLYLLGEL